MSSPNPYQQGQNWSNQQYQQPRVQNPENRYSKTSPPNHSCTEQNVAGLSPYIQPHYESTSPVPFIAELPAPLPPAPPTTTSEQQLKEDELLAHKLQQMQIEEVRRRSSSVVSQHQRPVSVAPPSPHRHSPLLHQRSFHSLRPHSQSVSSTTAPYTLSSSPRLPSPSLLPEVVPYYPQSTSENLPIPVVQDQNTVYPLPASLDPASSSAYLEQHLQVPYPSQWALAPVVATFYAYHGHKIPPSSTWLETPDSVTWRTIRPTENAMGPAPASYIFKFKTSGGSFRSSRLSWSMTCSGEQSNKLAKSKRPIWAYDLKFDSSTGLRKTEVLAHGRENAILTTYVHGLNYDSLRFIGPDSRAYMWVSSSALSSINGSRYDTLRHALFVTTGNIQDPLYGQIVADHTFWDGYVAENEVHVGIRCNECQMKPINGLRWICRTCPHHDVCDTCRTLALGAQFGASIQPTCDFSLVNLPNEALNIRSPTVDPELVVATLQILKDWEKHTLREEKKKNFNGFVASENAARKCDLGVMSYWKAGDWDKKGAEGEKFGTRVKARGIMQAYGETAAALRKVVDTGSSVGGNDVTIGTKVANKDGSGS